jgi:hypothetical protein
MNKREIVWLIVKLIGTYFVYLAVVSLFSLLSAVSSLYSLPAEQNSPNKPDANVAVSPVFPADSFPARQPNQTNKNTEKPTLDAASKKLRDDAVKTFLLYIFLTALYGAAGFYLIKDGQILFAVLMREGKIVSDTKEINSLGIFDQ